jgi:hypothetical protein
VVNLTAEDRKDLFKMSDKSQALVTKVTEYANTNPEFIPPYMSKADLQLDFDNAHLKFRTSGLNLMGLNSNL